MNKIQVNLNIIFDSQLGRAALWSPLLYTECPGGNVPDFGRMLLKLKYTDITKNTYIRSSPEVWHIPPGTLCIYRLFRSCYSDRLARGTYKQLLARCSRHSNAYTHKLPLHSDACLQVILDIDADLIFDHSDSCTIRTCIPWIRVFE